MRRPAVLLLLAAGLAGCGNARTQPPDVATPRAPAGKRTVRLAPAGIAFVAPRNWAPLAPETPQVGGIQSGTATLAIWRYPRSEPLPAGRAELRQARRRLVAEVRRRGPQVQIRSSRITQRAGAPAVELVARQPVAGVQRDVRSSHLFARGAEVVVDAYAPPAQFRRVDTTVFEPLLRSLRLSRPRA